MGRPTKFETCASLYLCIHSFIITITTYKAQSINKFYLHTHITILYT